MFQNDKDSHLHANRRLFSNGQQGCKFLSKSGTRWESLSNEEKLTKTKSWNKEYDDKKKKLTKEQVNKNSLQEEKVVKI